MEVRVDLSKIIISDTQQAQVIVLQERNGDRSFPIVIGPMEAQAIDRRVKSVPTARPLTHELLSNVVEGLHAELEKIVVSDLREQTFIATIVLRQDGQIVEIDSRPSDAIALVAGSDIPVYVEEHVLREASRQTPD